MNRFDIKRLVDVTFEILKEKSDLDLESLMKFGDEPDNIFKQISRNFYLNDEIKNCVNICSWWNCDTYEFSSLIREKLKNKDKELDKAHSLILSNIEWKKAVECISGQGREYFKTDFDVILSKKLQEKGFNCWLSNSYNWFKKQNSRKKNSNFWSGLYYCCYQKCGEFEAFIKNEPNFNSDVVVFLTARNIVDHEKLSKKIQVRGTRRNKLLNSIMMLGSDSARSNAIISNHKNEELLGI
jgi:hypothetical protein